MNTTLKYGTDFVSKNGLLSLPGSAVTNNVDLPSGKVYERTHSSGWTIKGVLHEDYFTWVTDFTASHPRFGIVKGNFMKKVTATSIEAYRNFVKKHPYDDWDTDDI